MSENLDGRVITPDLLVSVVAKDGMVFLLFNRAEPDGTLVNAWTDNFMINAKDALELLAPKISDMAFEADTGLKPVGPTQKAQLKENHRQVLTKRLEVNLNSMREDRKLSNRALAQHVAEVCIKEILQ